MLALATAVAAQPGAPARRPAASRTAALRALDRLIRRGLLQPGIRLSHPVRFAGTVSKVSYANWSGYADNGKRGATYTQVAGTWSQPAVLCPTDENEVAVFWVGLDGVSDSTVEQAGTLAQCFQGMALYYTWWEMYPTKAIVLIGKGVSPGDDITASVTFAAGKYTLAVADSTKPGNSFTKVAACAPQLRCANSSAEWIAETPGYTRGLAPWPNFGTWTVSSATVTGSGTAGVISKFPAEDITIVGSFGERLATTGSLDAAGNGFSDTWAYTW